MKKTKRIGIVWVKVEYLRDEDQLMMTITGKIEQALPVKGLSAYETKVLAVETYQAMIAEAEQKLTEWGIEYRIDRRESETIITTETYRYCFKVQEIVLQTQNAAKQNDNG